MMSTHAVLEWRNGLPYSTKFDDVYFSVSPEHPQHGLAETRYVFLQHNHLQQRWQKLPADRPSHFVIVETGFGSGLNFLAALQLWRENAPSLAHLHFVSIEIAPFTLDDLQQAHAYFPELAEASQALCQQYRLLQPGINQLELPAYSASLALHIGECAQVLPQLNLVADAWFLDGFSPAKNPDMWQHPLFECMARCSREDTTFATFTSAGFVRRGLESVGFHVAKTSGFGAKREMLCGYWPASQAKVLPAARLPKVAVIGAGIAGCSSAWFLASLGCEVQVFERSDTVASGASGNPRGMLYPRLNAETPLNDQLALRSYSFSLRHYANLGLPPEAFEHCGLLQLGGSAREQKRVHKVAARYAHLGLLKQLDAIQASAVAGVTLASDCLYFPEAAWVNPGEACSAMLRHAHIQLHLQQEIIALSRQPNGWQLQSALETHDGFDAVIVANAAEAARLLPDSGMWLNPIRGQMGMITGQAAMQGLKTILCGDGYLTPQHQGVHAMGATFAPGDTDINVREADNHSNLQMISRLSPQFHEAMTAQVTYARASSRCGSPDYLPYVGPFLPTPLLASMPHPVEQFSNLPSSHGLYVHVAHGSKGLLTAPYCAAVLARRLLNDSTVALPQMTEDHFWLGLHPQRHLFKQLGWKALLNPFHDKAAA